MKEENRKIYQAILSLRIEIALKRLKEKPHFLDILQRQKETEEVVQELLLKLETEERITVRRHFEKEIERKGEELNEVYLQGVMDCIQLFRFLGAFTPGVCL